MSDADNEEEEVTTSESEIHDPWKRPFYVMAAVHGYQYKTEYAKVSVIPKDDAASLIQALEEDLFHSDSWRYICPVRPQPCSQFVTVVVEYTWTRLLGLNPIYVDVIGPESRGFTAFIGQECSLADLIRLMGSDMVVYGEGIEGVMTEDSVYPTFKAMLFTVCRPGWISGYWSRIHGLPLTRLTST